MDLEVWFEGPGELRSWLPQDVTWEAYPSEYDHEGDGWLVVVGFAERGDPPEAVAGLCPAASHLVGVSLEPIGASPVGYAFLERVVRGLAAASGALWVDP